MNSISEEKIKVLKKLVPVIDAAACFDDAGFTVGRIQLVDRQLICVFNWGDKHVDFKVELDAVYRVSDFWTGIPVEVNSRKLMIKNMNPHSAKLFECID